jgi:penicillin-binding protein 1C
MAAVFALLPPDSGTMPVPILAPQLSSADIAPALLHIGAVQTVSSHPRITFPPPGGTVEADPGTPIPLQVSGGAAPYRWIIDGRESPPAPIGEAPSWTPPSPGFYHISVIDHANVEEDENIQVR